MVLYNFKIENLFHVDATRNDISTDHTSDAKELKKLKLETTRTD